MVYYAGLGVVLAQLLQQFVEGMALQFGASVVGSSVLVQSSAWPASSQVLNPLIVSLYERSKLSPS